MLQYVDFRPAIGSERFKVSTIRDRQELLRGREGLNDEVQHAQPVSFVAASTL